MILLQKLLLMQCLYVMHTVKAQSSTAEPNNECPEDEFPCSNGQCIAYTRRCDGVSDCRNGADEAEDTCKTFCPTDKYYTCNNGQCVAFSKLTSNEAACLDGSDENITAFCQNRENTVGCLFYPESEQEETEIFLRAAADGEKEIKKRHKKEMKLVKKDIVPAFSSATGLHQSLLNTSSEIKPFEDAVAIEAASKCFLDFLEEDETLKKRQLHTSPYRFRVWLRFIYSLFTTAFGWTHCPRVTCPSDDTYRTFDGRCNNIYIPLLGKAVTPFVRLLPPDYQDVYGLKEPRTKCIDGSPLPCAREVSQKLGSCTESKDMYHTMMVMQWGQFIDHDLTLSPTSKIGYLGKPIDCCSRRRRSAIHFARRHSECFPICIPREDPFYGCLDIACMNFVRTLSAPSIFCHFGPRQQVNDLSHFLDGSMIYGSQTGTANSLRTFTGGRLKVQTDNQGYHILPPQTLAAHCLPSEPYCFRAGDVRVNEQPDLAIKHIMWLREHNRIADHYTSLGYNDNDAYFKARKLVIAEIQHITYNEFLPVVLGPTFMSTWNMNPRPSGFYYYGYSPLIDPRISNAFSTAAFRFGHSLLGDNLEKHWLDFPLPTELPLSTLFANQGAVHYWKNRMMYAFGLTKQHSEKVDMCFTTEVTQRLFEESGVPGSGLDLVALNIQRGRDHGLPGYIYYRNNFCNSLNPVNSFNDMTWLSAHVKSTLINLYTDVRNIDLFVGGLLEPLQPGALVGETFQCIIGDQFYRSKRGDRYYYENPFQPMPFTIGQLNAIRDQVSLARIFCDDADEITKIQPNVFSISGSLEWCNGTAIPSLDLSLFP